MNEEDTVMHFEINQFIETYANSPVQNDLLDFWKNMSTSVKPIERIVSSLAEYFFTPFGYFSCCRKTLLLLEIFLPMK